MVWFKKKDRVIDLSERYKKGQIKSQGSSSDSEEESSSSSSGGMFGFFNNPSVDSSMNSSSSSTSSSSDSRDYVDISSGDSEEKKRKLAKRLMDMTDKIEDLINQIYKLQQRIEVLERKSGVSGY